MDITHCQKNKKIKRADKILSDVYGTTLIGCQSPKNDLISSGQPGTRIKYKVTVNPFNDLYLIIYI